MQALASAALISTALLAGTVANAAEFNVRIINLTNGIWYTPFLVAAHPAGTSLFTSGQPASASLQAMAEGGDISGLLQMQQNRGHAGYRCDDCPESGKWPAATRDECKR